MYDRSSVLDIIDTYELFKKSSIPTALENESTAQEEAGCTVDFRCDDCMGCIKCKQSSKVRNISIKEEAEEARR